jgi:hypothetical protein
MNSRLTPKRSKLRGIIQSLAFGSIEGLRIECGEPCFEIPPRILRDIKIGSAPTAPPDQQNQDFLLQNKMLELFECLDQLGSTTVTIEVKHSQPFRIVAECATDHQR